MRAAGRALPIPGRTMRQWEAMTTTARIFVGIMIAVALPQVALASSSRAADSLHDDLAPTTAVPWNPSQAIPAQETWEAVVRAPGRLASLPLSLVGVGARRGIVVVE